jgi:hypothetical protein
MTSIGSDASSGEPLIKDPVTTTSSMTSAAEIPKASEGRKTPNASVLFLKFFIIIILQLAFTQAEPTTLYRVQDDPTGVES